MPGNGNRLDRIEAALERITARHEALAQTVEVLGGMQQASEQRIARLTDHLDRLLTIVESHERRLTDLEGDQP